MGTHKVRGGGVAAKAIVKLLLASKCSSYLLSPHVKNEPSIRDGS